MIKTLFLLQKQDIVSKMSMFFYNRYMKRTIRQQVYSLLKERIMNDYYKPGYRLSEQEICDELHVSRSPVREALRDLEADDLVIGEANKGVRIRVFTEQDVKSFYEIEMNFQLSSVEDLPKKLPEDVINIYKELKKDFEESYKNNDLQKYLNTCERLHRQIVRLSTNTFFEPLYRKIGTLNHRFRLISLKNFKRFDQSYTEHIDMIDAILDGDITKAKKVIRTHFGGALDVVLMTTPQNIE